MTVSSFPRTVEWVGGIDGFVRMIDQTRLPHELVMLECRDTKAVWEAIKRLSVRGAPAIGIAGAMGAALGILNHAASDRASLLEELDRVCDYLVGSRPTAVNLAWALERMKACARNSHEAEVSRLKESLLAEAIRIRDEDAEMCRAIGQFGEPLITEGCRVLTHCNAGSLATAEFGTALAPFYVAHQRGRRFKVYADETRPLLQGARLTAWELQQAGIDVTVLCDNMAGALMQNGGVDLVITGADRIAANGDVANKIGTYSVAVIAQAHRIPFYVAAPSSTFDLSLPDGSGIPIEHRDADEVRSCLGHPIAPAGVECYCPAFDVTPARLIRGIITERGVISPLGTEVIARLLGEKSST